MWARLFGAGSVDAFDEVVAGVGGLFVGWDEAGVVAGEFGGGVAVQFGGFGVGEDEPVRVGAAGQLDVGAFAVEAVGADGDGQVPGAALGAVGGEGVAVVDVAAAGQVAVG